MGTFRTKLDFSDNRQVKQRIETTTNLSGATTFGVPYGNLPTGPNPVLSSITQSISNILGTFSGNSGTTVFTWTDSRFNLGDSSFSAITPTNSGDTQNSGNVFVPVTSSLFTIDGNSGYTQYSGVSFTMYPTTFIGLGGGAYSGELGTYVSQIIDATGLDFSGRTIWNDVSGITRTDRLIISRNPQIGYVWTCLNSEGMGEWQPSSGSSSGTTIWTAGTGTGSAVLGGSNGIASNTNSVSEGYNTIASGYASHAEGSGTIASGNYSHAEGYSDSSGITTASGEASHAEGWATLASGDYSHAQGHKTIASGESSHASGYYSNVYSDNGFAHSYFSTIETGSTYSSILGGHSNLINNSEYSSILGGYLNDITGNTGNNYNMILGGNNNNVYNHTYSTIINGSGNTIHFDLLDFSYPNALEMIENSKDSVISASTLSKISSSDRMTIANSVSSTIINSLTGNFDPDPYITGGGIIGTDNPNDNGVNTIIGTYEGLIRYKAASNTIIGSTIARIDGTAGGVGGANANFIGNSGSVSISDQYNTSGFSSYNTIFGSYASSMRTPNSYSSIMGSSYVNMEYSDTTSIISSKDSEISTGITSSIIGGTGHTLTTTESSMILGGALNTIDTAKYSIIVGGSGNTVTKNIDNLTQPNYSGIFAGKDNTIIPRFGYAGLGLSGSYCAIVGGESNTISGHSHSFIGGGFNNLIECDAAYNAIIAGQNNINHAWNGVIIGGQDNTLGFSTSCPSASENSIILGGKLNKISLSVNDSWNTAIIGGENNLIDNTVNDIRNTVIIGGEYITANTSDTVYVPNMIINTGGTQSKLGINTNSPEYVIDVNGNSARLVLADTYTGNDLPFKSFVFSANSTNVPQIVASTSNYTGGLGLALAMGIVGNNSVSTPTSELVGLSGDTYINSTQQTNNLNILNRSGGSGTNNIRMYAGVNSVSAASVPDFLVRGSGTTRGFVGVGVVEPTQQLDISGNTRIRSIGSSASSGALHYTADGTLTTNTSDERLKTNIITLTGALDKVNQLRGVTYNWTENPNGDARIGFIAQEVNAVVPELTFTNPNSPENYMGVHYDNVTALLVEAVKELSSGVTTSNNTHLETQTILAEDNNIELNFNGTQQTALGGGLTVLHAKGQGLSSDLITDTNGNFVTNNDFKPQALTIPLYTPTSSNDTAGSEGNITRDDNYMYVKTSTGWKRTNLENF